MFCKTAASVKDAHLALPDIRSTPVTGLKYSSAQLLMGHMLRMTLPSTRTLLQPTVPHRVGAQLQQKEFYNWTAKPLPMFLSQYPVYMEISQVQKPAKIIALCPELC